MIPRDHLRFLTIRCIAAGSLSSLAAFQAVAGDAPNGVVHTGSERTPGLRSVPTWLPVKRVGALTAFVSTLGPLRVPVPLILTDGSLRLQFDQGTAPPEGFPEIPAGATELEQVFHLTPDGTRPWFIARRSDGVLVQWAQGDVPYQPPVASWRTVAAGNTNAGGIAASGSVVAWSIDGPISVAGAPTLARQLTLGAGWGAAIDAQGALHSLGLGGAAPPALPDLGPLLAASALPFSSATNPRLAAIRADGSLAGTSGSFLGAVGPYAKISYGQGGVIALRADGSVDHWSSISSSRRRIPGVYDEVQSLWANVAVWSADTDRNGEPDRAQILRGERPDVNGDLVDDRLQAPSVLLDLDGNGVADAGETRGNAVAAVAPSPAGTTLWTESMRLSCPPGQYRVAWIAHARVRVGAETVTRLSLPIARPQDSVPAGGLPAILHVWSDPDQDSDPADLKELAAVPIVITDAAMQTFDFAPITLGVAGQSYFFGISHEQGGNGPGVWPVAKRNTESLATSDDAAAGSRLNGRIWVSYVPATSGQSATAPLSTAVVGGGVLRGYGSTPEVQGLLAVSLLPDGGTAADCNANGVLDSLELRDIPEIADPNGNGTLDGCESGTAWGDLNQDGRVDGADIAVLFANWGPAQPGGIGDLDGDGTVGGRDLGVLLSRWRPSAP